MQIEKDSCKRLAFTCTFRQECGHMCDGFAGRNRHVDDDTCPRCFYNEKCRTCAFFEARRYDSEKH